MKPLSRILKCGPGFYRQRPKLQKSRNSSSPSKCLKYLRVGRCKIYLSSTSSPGTKSNILILWSVSFKLLSNFRNSFSVFYFFIQKDMSYFSFVDLLHCAVTLAHAHVRFREGWGVDTKNS